MGELIVINIIIMIKMIIIKIIIIMDILLVLGHANDWAHTSCHSGKR